MSDTTRCLFFPIKLVNNSTLPSICTPLTCSDSSSLILVLPSMVALTVERIFSCVLMVGIRSQTWGMGIKTLHTVNWTNTLYLLFFQISFFDFGVPLDEEQAQSGSYNLQDYLTNLGRILESCFTCYENFWDGANIFPFLQILLRGLLG